MTARPEIATVELDGDEDFVVVACDGLWDFVSEDDVALAVYRQLAADPGKWKTQLSLAAHYSTNIGEVMCTSVTTDYFVFAYAYSQC